MQFPLKRQIGKGSQREVNMATTPSIEFSGRGQPIGPMDFNRYLEQPASFFDEEGQTQEMTLHAAVVRGENIAQGLEGRVKAFNELNYSEPQTFKTSLEEGDALVDQYDTLCLLVATVKGAVDDFKGMTARYDRDLDKEITASYPVMCYQDSFGLSLKFESFVKNMETGFLTGGTLKTYLVDRVAVLKGNLQAIKV